jgi:hypothetical protein
VADILYLAPEGAPHVFRPPPSALRGDQRVRRGFNFDGCAPEALLSRASVKDGDLVLPDGMRYRVLVLPEFETMTPRLLHKICSLVQAGATVVGSPPRKSPSLAGFPQCDGEVQQLADELWGPAPAALAGAETVERRFGQGRIVRPVVAAPPGSTAPPDIYPSYELVAGLLTSMHVPPDFESDEPLRYTHRRDGETDIYFVANPDERVISTKALFRVAGRRPELWGAVTGQCRPLPELARHAGRTEVPLRLEPHESFFIVFREATNGPQAGGKDFVEFTTLATVAGPWRVQFQPQRGAPAEVPFDTLADWSKHADAGVRTFSGIATYRATFELPDKDLADRTNRLFLNLGRVAVIAQVVLNGRDLGVVWTQPFRLDATDALRPGANTLEVRVANLWPNRLIADAGLPPEKRITATTWNPFQPETPLLESGLLGPVTVQRAPAPSAP